VRLPFPGEISEISVPEEHVLILVLRQVEPGTRVKAGFFLHAELWPLLPDNEAVAHALFDVAIAAVGSKPVEFDQLQSLIERYSAMQQTH
jgi:hypothetical protein